MISHKHKCIFIHIPKCAGTSVESVFGHFSGYKGRGGQDHRSLRMIENPLNTLQIFSSTQNVRELVRRVRFNNRKHKNANNAHQVTPSQYQEYLKFTIVRNPWARVFSWYHNVIRDAVHRQNHGIDENCTLPEFLQRFAGKGMLQPQTYWIKDFSGDIPLDHILRFENLEAEYKQVAQKLNLPETELPSKNKGRTQKYHEYYNSEARDLVSRLYREEIERFDYSFEG